MSGTSKVFSALLATVLILGLSTASALAEDEAPDTSDEALLQAAGTVASGTWGTCPWEISSSGTLTIHPGTGVTVVGANDTFWFPWATNMGNITSVVFAEENGRKIIAPENFSHFFGGLGYVESIDLTGLDTSNVTNMSYLFAGCGSLFSLDLTGLDTSNVTDMSNMFNNCFTLSSLDLSPLNTSSVENMSNMLCSCYGLKVLNCSGLDTSNVEDMSDMFSGCNALTSLDLSSFDTSQVVNMNYMFVTCRSLTTVFASEKWSTRSVTSSEGMFGGCSALVGGNGTKYIIGGNNDATYACIDAPGTPGYLTRKVPAEELAGAGRYDTAATIATQAFPVEAGGAEGVIIATGKDFPDALGASSLAGMLDWPILLTEPGSLSQATYDAIVELGADQAIVVGGAGAVSPKVEKQLQDLVGKEAVGRVAGDNRYKTAEAIYAKGDELGEWGTTAILSTGKNYPDALSISGYAFHDKAPIFLCDPSKGLSAETKAALGSGGFTQVVIVGGTGAVPESAERWVEDNLGITPLRLAGANRYDTSKAIAEFVLENGGTAEGACIATGANFPDALAGGALVGRTNTILLLADPGKTTTLNVLSANVGDIEHIFYLGGIGAVPQSVRYAAETAAGMR